MENPASKAVLCSLNMTVALGSGDCEVSSTVRPCGEIH
jgi:hypothetical protein